MLVMLALHRLWDLGIKESAKLGMVANSAVVCCGPRRFVEPRRISAQSRNPI